MFYDMLYISKMKVCVNLSHYLLHQWSKGNFTNFILLQTGNFTKTDQRVSNKAANSLCKMIADLWAS